MRQKGFKEIIVLACVLITFISLILIFKYYQKKALKISNLSNNTSNNIITNWKTYKDIKMDFSFKYPENLSYVTISSGDLIFLDNKNDDYENCKQEIKLQGTKEFVNGTCLTKGKFTYHRLNFVYEKYFKDSMNDLTNMGFSSDLFKDNQDRVWGIRFKLAKDGEPLIYNAYFSRGDGKYNLITFSSIQDDIQNIALFKQILSTIEFID